MRDASKDDFDRSHTAHGTTYHELINISEKELRHRFDLLRTDRQPLTATDYRDELNRREVELQSRRLEWLTWALVALTIVLAVATIALVWIELQRH